MSVNFEDSIVVRVRDDRDLVLAFMEWGLANHVFGIRGFGSSGMGGLSGVYEAKDAPAIRQFFKDYANAKRRAKAAAKKAQA